MDQRTVKSKSVTERHQPVAVSSASHSVSVQSSIFDLFARVLVSKGHSIEALCFFFSVSADRLLSAIVRLDLPTPPTQPFRISRRTDAWTAEQIQQLMMLWPTNLYASVIAERIGRTPASVRYKAKWLGLPTRKRSDLCRDVCATAIHALVLFPDSPTRSKRRPQFNRTWDTDLLVGTYHLTGVDHEVTAETLGLTKRDVECIAWTLELPPRHFKRGRLKMSFDPASPHLKEFAPHKFTLRECMTNKNVRFWGPKNGSRISRASKRSKAYQDKVSSADENDSFEGDTDD